MVSKLRRLIADHADLHNNELPPNYLFSPADTENDDLSQLVVMLAGPQGTPYSAGLWRLQLRIPEDYPASPPKAAFKTRIWHPNVEESTGAVCVDTLKRDWESKLTLRDILVTISCLLIHPNPDSALNPMAGSLLQDDYNEFARQARLMTSIHAPVPFALKQAVLQAKQRGEDPEMAARSENEQEIIELRHQPKSSSLVMKKKHSEISPPQPSNADEDMDDIEDDCKENDPSLSPEPVPILSSQPKRNGLAKKPLSVIPTTPVLETDMIMLDCASDDEDMLSDGMTASERNIAANNTISLKFSSPYSSQNSSVFSTRFQTPCSSQAFPGLHNTNDSTPTSYAIYKDDVELDNVNKLLLMDTRNNRHCRRPTYGKENITGSFSSLPKELSNTSDTPPFSTPTGVVMKSLSTSSSSSSILSPSTAATRPLSPTKVTKPTFNGSNNTNITSTRKAVSGRGKPRIGLRRL
ncbi:ubiquitin conjugating enzyme E2, putative [Talaromyces stipitatus ATCC 10500]|uniref:Ubiquitin conjugating enzyme E2, putative n=1 Tax=Talaromyces stipitatus (strain ATCC 10500 / CBS 375.48 / QM 6759 / NRRL 1006) TaxID=441959 RepID=B8LVP8_TALSN|nr:ubiquitin conjugating enzyme E2, putative [Talaromyces stipitatus ATCC 10500]EED24178.1 ubiquitin conjugating enzyme E2, putative [Talaromyces stipitatus ATCC 10500]